MTLFLTDGRYISLPSLSLLCIIDTSLLASLFHLLAIADAVHVMHDQTRNERCVEPVWI